MLYIITENVVARRFYLLTTKESDKRMSRRQGHSMSQVIMSCMTACMIFKGNHVKFARFVLLVDLHIVIR